MIGRISPIFWISTLLITIVLAAAAFYGSSAESFFHGAQRAVTHYTGWLMILIINLVLFFMVYLAVGPYRSLRLGGEQSRPEFSRLSWFGMLFAAGMGIGLLFYSVAEPLRHYEAFLPQLDGNTAETARFAMNKTFLHWGLHAWAVYGLVAMTLAWFHYRKGQAPTFSGPLTAMASARLADISGTVLNIFAVLGTVFGVATSLGLGTSQASAGLARLTGLQTSLDMQIALIVIVSLAALASVVSGVDKGVRIISKLNLLAALALMIFVLFAGETIFVLKAFGQHLGYYANHFLESSSWRETYTGTDWQSQWTLFYWAWWISWSPFVGLFIARVSKGRTIGEFVIGVLAVPTMFNFAWMTVFGSNALHNVLFDDASLLHAGIDASLYAFLETLPLSTLLIAVATIIVLLFFVTSADSGALVTATLATGEAQPPKWQRAFWALVVMVVTAVLLVSGGLTALQTATIITGVPFAIILVLLGLSLLKDLRANHGAEDPAAGRIDDPSQREGA